MDWVDEEFIQNYGAKYVMAHHKHPGITVEMDTKVLIDFLNRRGDWKLLPVGIGGSLFEDFLVTKFDVHNQDVRLYISGTGKTNVIVTVDVDWIDREQWKMRRRSRVKIAPRSR
jgi:hypothetical protein